MGSEFPQGRLGEQCKKIGSGATPRGGNSVYLSNGEYVLIRSQNIHNNEFKSEGLVYISQEHVDKLSNVAVEANDVLLNITGDSVARCCQAPSSAMPARVNQHVAIIRPDEKKLHAGFLRYYLVSYPMQNYMLGLAGAGATRNALTKGMIESFQIPLPPLSEQKAIANILGTLDDKIELNRQMNQTLEAMAQALFKSWFVDFDPVIDNALDAGNPIPEALQARADQRQKLRQQAEHRPLPDSLRQQFPQAFVFTEEMGWVPEGWEPATLKDACNVGVGGSIQTGPFGSQLHASDYVSQGIPSIMPKNIGDNRFNTTDVARISDADAKRLQKYRVVEGDIVYSRRGDVEKRSLVRRAQTGWLCGTGCLRVRFGKDGTQPLFAACYLGSAKSKEWIVRHAIGATMPNLNTTILGELPMLIPGAELESSFASFVGPWDDLGTSTFHMGGILAKLRDTLLPKLISGELRIPDAERLLAEAV